MSTLSDMLKANPKFQENSLTQQEIFLRLAEEFDENDFALYLTPRELETKLSLGNRHQWEAFLSLEPVQAYIKTKTAEVLTIQQRKNIQTLTQASGNGNVQAAIELNKLSGIYQQGDQNRTVVLHQIQRPKVQKQQQTQTQPKGEE